ncbi:MAG: 16S rRNA (cytosine(967)-C(5))-methyltransferase RsmB [Candidatus Neomarinimicrobiota bacterium]
MRARTAAVEILNSLHKQPSDFETRVSEFVSTIEFSQEDRDFIYALVKGVIQYRRLLDYILTFSLNRQFSQIEVTAVNLLRIGAFQLVVLKTPPHALVYETVEAAKELKRPDLGPLINAVLRNLPEEAAWRKSLSRIADETERLGIEFSHPDWLVKRWMANFGVESTRRILEFNNSYQPICFRHNPIRFSWTKTEERLAQQKQTVKIISEKPIHFFSVSRPGILLKSDFFKEGGCSVQDYNQALAVLLLSPKEGETIVDVCAAPGGKSTFIAQLAGNRSAVHASDINEQKMNLVKNECLRLGIDSINYHVADASRDAFPEADKVLIDAPCTGTGVLSRRADLRWNRTVHHMKQVRRLQIGILENVAKYVRIGGTLVYSTCSLEPEENWDVVREFLAGHPEFSVQPAQKWIEKTYCDDSGAVQILPHRHNLTGSFAVRLNKTSSGALHEK